MQINHDLRWLYFAKVRWQLRYWFYPSHEIVPSHSWPKSRETQKTLAPLFQRTWSGLDTLPKCLQNLRMLRFLKRNCSGDLKKDSLKLLYVSLLRSNLCYASQLWAPQSPTLMLEVENIQRRATRFIFKISELSYKDRLLNLNLLPINY